jgi:hypothetical protein
MRIKNQSNAQIVITSRLESKKDFVVMHVPKENHTFMDVNV